MWQPDCRCRSTLEPATLGRFAGANAMTSSFSRRDVLQLAAVIGSAGLVTALLRSTAPIGRDIGLTSVVNNILEDVDAPTDGNPAGDVTIVVYTDYQCPACRRANRSLEEAVGTDGEVRLVYKDWPIFGALSRAAAQAAIAADRQRIYPRVHHLLMEGPGRVDEAVVRKAVLDAGGNWERLLIDLDNRKAKIDRMLARHAFEAFSLGLPGTPGYLIGTILVSGAISARQFGRVIAQARNI